MRREPEAITLAATAGGIVFAIAGAALLIAYAVFTGAGLASPIVTPNLTRLSL